MDNAASELEQDRLDELDDEVTDLAASQVVTKLEMLVRESIAGAKDHWHRLTADERGAEVVRIRKRLRADLPDIIAAIASRGMPYVLAEVAGYSSAAKGTAFKLLVSDESRDVHRFIDLKGARVPVLLVTAAQYEGADDDEQAAQAAQDDRQATIDFEGVESAHAVESAERGVADDETDPDDDRQHVH